MRQLTLILLFLTFRMSINGQGFVIVKTGVFEPQKKKVLILENDQKKKLLLFKSNLNVNTDGAPLSYHPNDLSGRRIAINTILNGVSIYRLSGNIKISNPPKSLKLSKHDRSYMANEALRVFKKWQDTGYDTFPKGYRIVWENVLANDGEGRPCIFKSGKYKGYYGSLTSLKNDLSDKGECKCKDQVDPLQIPSIVLAGGRNILISNGAGVGDLVIAYHIKTKNIVYAIIADRGPKHNLGEGSVSLNMMLMGITALPANRKDTYRLSIDSNDVLISIIPGSAKFRKVRPFSMDNIKSRVAEWFIQQGISDERELSILLEANSYSF